MKKMPQVYKEQIRVLCFIAVDWLHLICTKDAWVLPNKIILPFYIYSMYKSCVHVLLLFHF